MKKADIYAVIRRNIKKYKTLKNITQAELAEKSDLSYNYIRQIESEKVANTFSVQTIYDISVVLYIDIGLLFKEKKRSSLLRQAK